MGPTMATLLDCQRPEDRDPEWWIQETEAGQTALLCRQNGVFRIHAAPGADGEELAQFVRMAGFEAAQLPQELAPAFAALGCRLERRALMEAPPSLRGGEPLVPLTAGQLEGVAATAFPAFAARRDGGRWLWEFSRKARRGLAFAAGVQEAGEILAAGAVTHRGTGRAVLGYICCTPSCRGRGLGSRVVTGLAARCVQEGEVPVLLCREELVPFYRRMGFVPIRAVWEAFPLPSADPQR